MMKSGEKPSCGRRQCSCCVSWGVVVVEEAPYHCPKCFVRREWAWEYQEGFLDNRQKEIIAPILGVVRRRNRPGVGVFGGADSEPGRDHAPSRGVEKEVPFAQ